MPPPGRDPETIPVTLANGLTIHVTADDLADLASRMDTLTQTAEDRRRTHRLAHVDPNSHGLERAPTYGRTDQWRDAYSLPGAYGTLPYGVPVLIFTRPDQATGSLFTRSPGSAPPPREEEWHLVLSVAPNHPLERVRYDDPDGFARLASRLTDPLDVLETQLVLTHPDLPDALQRPENGDAHRDFARRVLSIAEQLPPLNPSDYQQAAARAHIRLSQVRVLDPDLCRYVQVPGILNLAGQRSTTTRDMDTFARTHDLHPMRGRQPSWTGPSRYVTGRATRALLGTLPSFAWWVLDPSIFKQQTFLRALLGDMTQVVNRETLTPSERQLALPHAR
jgi:hypothetical protein